LSLVAATSTSSMGMRHRRGEHKASGSLLVRQLLVGECASLDWDSLHLQACARPVPFSTAQCQQPSLPHHARTHHQGAG
jgi:hypothetical protein